MTEPRRSDALRTVLAELPAHLSPDRLERIWIFPPKQIAGRESGLLVLALLPPADGATASRQLVTVRYESQPTRRPTPPQIVVTQEGWVPADRLPRVIAGVMARLGDAEEPSEHEVLGRAEGWAAVLHEYGVDPGNGE